MLWSLLPVGTCVILLLGWFEVPACFGQIELHRGKQCGCWLLVSLMKCGCCSRQKDEIIAVFYKKNNFPIRPIKRLAQQEVQPPCFLVICTQCPANWHPKLPIKWYDLIYFVSLVEKRCSSICAEKKTTENSIQMVSALGLPEINWKSGDSFFFKPDIRKLNEI